MPNKNSQFNDEIKFLIACCQTVPSEDLASALNEERKCPWGEIADTPVVKTKEGCDIKFILSYLNAERLELNALIALANQHGILPLVYKTIKKLHEEDLLNTESQSDSSQSPQSPLALNADTPVVKTKEGCITNYQLPGHLLADLKSAYLKIARRNMLMSAELIRIIKLLEKNSIEALAFKGPVLSQMAYGDITLRQYIDLDVLVKKEDIYKIDNLLKDRGYQRVLKLTSEKEKLWLKFKHDLGLYHPRSGVHFEMHWSLLDEDYPIQMNTDTLWKNPQIVKINQQEIKTFPTEDLLLYLCIHGSTHLWERIEWIKDIDLLIQTQEIDWHKITEKAKSSNVETIFYLGIYLANTLFSTELPNTLSKRINHNPKLPLLSDYIFKSWQGDNVNGIGGTLQRTLAMLRLFPDTKALLSYLHKITLKPTLNEYDYIDLPKRMYWAYYFIRPYLLMKKYVSNS